MLTSLYKLRYNSIKKVFCRFFNTFRLIHVCLAIREMPKHSWLQAMSKCNVVEFFFSILVFRTSTKMHLYEHSPKISYKMTCDAVFIVSFSTSSISFPIAPLKNNNKDFKLAREHFFAILLCCNQKEDDQLFFINGASIW